nr:immunoglobulin light chain junction region [Macaca mulatta]
DYYWQVWDSSRNCAVF